MFADKAAAMAALADANVTRAALFGSVARGVRRVPGDIDLLIWPNNRVGDDVLHALVQTLGVRWAYPVHIAIYDRLEPVVAASALRDAITLNEETRDLIESYTRRVVDGYETHEDWQERDEAQKEAIERGVRDMFRCLAQEVALATERLRSQPPAFMIEVWDTTFMRGKPVVRQRVPGWTIGSISPPGDSYGYSQISFALGNDGRLYASGGPAGTPTDGKGRNVGAGHDRRAFMTRGQWPGIDTPTNRRYIGALIELLRAAR